MEDMYTYYVLILGIPETVFWHAEYSDLLTIAEDKDAYDGWLNYAREKMLERRS